jgi:dTDP-4-dehydrorhamnose 3,5-epimerase
MDVVSLHIDAVKLIRPRRHEDLRGFFVETWNRKTLAANGIETDFVQDNSSLSRQAGTIRGLHYQIPPFAQCKLVRVARGAAFDVAVDLRAASPTFGRYAAATLTAERGEQLFIPVGFAHGFCTLEPDTELAYKVSEFHAPEHDAGICWDDPAIGIEWPLSGREPILSDRDRMLPRLSAIHPPF